jgi:ABC-type hemin transport system ATPase subunit
LAHYCDECLCLNCHVCACGAPQDVLTTEVLTEMYGPLGGVPSHGHGLAGDDHGHHH